MSLDKIWCSTISVDMSTIILSADLYGRDIYEPIIGIFRSTCAYWLEVEDRRVSSCRCAGHGRRQDGLTHIRIRPENLVDA